MFHNHVHFWFYHKLLLFADYCSIFVTYVKRFKDSIDSTCLCNHRYGLPAGRWWGRRTIVWRSWVGAFAELCRIAVNGYRQYKHNIKKIGKVFSELLQRIQLLPISSSECERGFTAMNMNQTGLLNRLHISTLSALLFIKINVHPAADFQVCLTFNKSKSIVNDI